MTKSKRLRFAIVVLLVNFIIFCVALYLDRDLTATGVGLMTLNAPLLVYILGESYRPSGKKPGDSA